jgi:hypothetical protein
MGIRNSGDLATDFAAHLVEALDFHQDHAAQAQFYSPIARMEGADGGDRGPVLIVTLSNGKRLIITVEVE